MDVALSQIKAGTGGALTETDITNSSVPIFNDDLDWVPGDAIILSFKLKNIGTLALRWQIHLEPDVPFADITKEKLAGKIDVFAFTDTDVIDPTKDSSYYAEKMGTKKGTLQDLYYGFAFLDGVLKKSGDEGYFAIVLQLQSDTDASHQGLKAGKFDIRIVAAQASTESDVYNDLYDDVIYVTSRKDFVEADYGGKIVMPSDIIYHNNNTSSSAWMLLEAKSEIDFNGENNTLTLSSDTTSYSFNHNYFGFITPAKTDIKVRNLKVTGTGFVVVGDHGIKPSGNYTVDNLVVENICTTHVVNDSPRRIAHAFGAYAGGKNGGTTTLNNCIMTGTTTMDTTATGVYDAGFPNDSRTIINGGKYGKIYGWASSNVTIYGAKIGTIDSRAWQGAGTMIIGAGTIVDTINIYPVKNKTSHLVIEPGASVGTINYNGTLYTMEEWINNPPGTFT